MSSLKKIDPCASSRWIRRRITGRPPHRFLDRRIRRGSGQIAHRDVNIAPAQPNVVAAQRVQRVRDIRRAPGGQCRVPARRVGRPEHQLQLRLLQKPARIVDLTVCQGTTGRIQLRYGWRGGSAGPFLHCRRIHLLRRRRAGHNLPQTGQNHSAASACCCGTVCCGTGCGVGCGNGGGAGIGFWATTLAAAARGGSNFGDSLLADATLTGSGFAVSGFAISAFAGSDLANSAAAGSGRCSAFGTVLSTPASRRSGT